MSGKLPRTALAVALRRGTTGEGSADALAELLHSISGYLCTSDVAALQPRGGRLVAVAHTGSQPPDRPLMELESDPEIQCFPLYFADEFQGVIVVHGSPEDEQPHTEQTLAPLLDLAALLLRNMRLESESRLAETERGSVHPQAFRALYELATIARHSPEPDAVAQRTVDLVRDLLGIHHAAVYWWNADAALLGPVADNDPRGQGEGERTLSSGQGTIGLAFERREPIVVDDFLEWSGATRRSIDRGIRSAASVPLLVGERAVGVLVARTYEAHHFTEGEIALLTLMAAGVAPTLELTRLYAESRRRQTEAEALARLAREGAGNPDPERTITLTTHEACRIFGADYAAVALLQGSQLNWRATSGTRTDIWNRIQRPTARGPVNRSLVSGHTVVASRIGENPEFPATDMPTHLAEGGRTVMSTPLIANGATIGALLLGWRSDVSLGTESITLAETLAGYAATIIDNAQVHASLTRLNGELERRVEERTTELQASYRELETFSYSVSHDLRTPLRAIDGFSLAMLEDYWERLDDQGRDYLQRLRNATQRMGRLIDAILSLSRVARSEVRRQEVDVSAIARSLASEMRRGEPAREIEFVIADGATARADPDLLRLALQNLMGNAWKFTRKQPAPEISIGSFTEDGGPIFYVKDNGVGFDMEYADRLFRPFERLHDATAFEGDGVGLATVQKIIQRHGGQIWADGQVGAGASFYFTLEGR